MILMIWIHGIGSTVKSNHRSLSMALEGINTLGPRGGHKRHAHDTNAWLVSPFEYYSPDLYTYKYNSHGFRSVDFSSEIDILTVGCSHTFGSGLPFEYTWSQQLQKKIPNKKIATIAVPGMSIQNAISYLFNYFKEIGNPKMIICNFPDFSRFEVLTKELELVDYYSMIYKNSNLSIEKLQNIKESFADEAWGYYINIKYISMLEQYCESSGIKLIWSTWQYYSHNYKHIFNEIGFDNLDEYLRSTFKHYHSDDQIGLFQFVKTQLYFDKNKKIKYPKKLDKVWGDFTVLDADEMMSKLMNCHMKEREETEDFFEVAYDRYLPPKEHANISDHPKISRIEKDKYLNPQLSHVHFGSHANIHWAEFYFDIVKEKYPDFII